MQLFVDLHSFCFCFCPLPPLIVACFAIFGYYDALWGAYDFSVLSMVGAKKNLKKNFHCELFQMR